jgi:hypothetical protein
MYYQLFIYLLEGNHWPIPLATSQEANQTSDTKRPGISPGRLNPTDMPA